MAVAERMLLSSFMVWPMPGCVPMKNTLPRWPRMGFRRSRISSGQDTMMARVPLFAPVTPPLMGASTSRMFLLARPAAMRFP